MARSDYESLVAPKPTAEKIEKFRQEAGYPSKSQALSAIVNELETFKTAHESIAALIEELRRYIGKLEEGVSTAEDETRQSIDRILSAITAILSTVTGLKVP